MEDFKVKYEILVKKITDLLDTQQAYFKSNKDIQLLKKAKALEADVKKFINPKLSEQTSLFEFLAR
jgi:hypothetical protein